MQDYHHEPFSQSITPYSDEQNPSSEEQNKPKGRPKRLLKIALSWLIAIIIALALQRFAFQSYQVFGQSMESTLQEGDYLIISKIGATLASIGHKDYVPKRGEIIVIDSQITLNRLIKRVIALPDERVAVKDGKVIVYNNEEPQGFDPYERLGLPYVYTDGNISIRVPEGHIYVIGDNRVAGGSLDSRSEIGPVDTKEVIGELVLRLWPLSKIGFF